MVPPSMEPLLPVPSATIASSSHMIFHKAFKEKPSSTFAETVTGG